MKSVCHICSFNKPDCNFMICGCNHLFCSECISEWFCGSIEINLQNPILRCPNQKCRKNFTTDEVTTMMKKRPKLFNRLNEALFKRYLHTNE